MGDTKEQLAKEAQEAMSPKNIRHTLPYLVECAMECTTLLEQSRHLMRNSIILNSTKLSYS